MDALSWETESSLWELLSSLEGRVSQRKLRLFALACFRRDGRVGHYRCLEALRVLERLAEEKVPRKELETVRTALPLGDEAYPTPNRDDVAVARALELLLNESLTIEEAYQATGIIRSNRSWGRARVRLLRDVMGNPFRPAPVVDPAWLEWERGLVRHLATVAYDGRAYDRLPILGDALEDAGCDHAELLVHLRGEGPHVLGCWALDALLGKS